MYTDGFKWLYKNGDLKRPQRDIIGTVNFMPSVVRGLQRHASRSSAGLPERENLAWALVKTTGIWICLQREEIRLPGGRVSLVVL